MKKIILSIAMVSGLIISNAYASNVSDDDKKKTEAIDKLKSDCKESMAEAGNGLDEESVGKLCDCLGDSASKIFTADELEAINNENFEGVDMEKVQQFQEAIQECAMNMQ